MYLLVRLTYGSLPQFPLAAGLPFAVLGVAEAIGGSALRARIRGRSGTRPVPPLVAARAVLVARASAQAGAIMAGAWAGLLAYVAPRSGDLAAAADDTAAAALGVVGALLLVGGGAVAAALLPHPRRPRRRAGRRDRPGASICSPRAPPSGPERDIRGPICTDSRGLSGWFARRAADSRVDCAVALAVGLARMGRCGSRATVGLRP